MHPQLVSRDALLDDPRFWCLLYEQWLKPRVDDVFAEGEDYFFLTPEDSVGELFHELEAIAVNEGRFPAVSVLVDLANGWRAGVELMMCPEDFEVDYVVVPPLSGEHKIIGVYGGNHWLPALRWEELLLLAAASRPMTAMSNARGVLLFYPPCFPDESRRDEVRKVLHDAWSEVGFPVRHLDEWIDRTDQCTSAVPWKKDPDCGWICENDHSLRNPRWAGRHHRWTSGMLSAVTELFTSL